MACTEAQLRRAREYRERHKETLRAKRLTPEARSRNAEKMRKWRAANPDKAKLIEKRSYTKNGRRYREENKDLVRSIKQRYRQANIEKIRDRMRIHYLKNRERISAWHREYRRLNRDKRRESERRSAVKNADRIREYRARYRKTFSESINAKTRNRRARLRLSVGKHTAKEIANLYEKQRHKCATCKTKISDKPGILKYHVDHVLPLALDGPNDISNLQLLCPKCNKAKRAMHPDEWAKQNGLLFC